MKSHIVLLIALSISIISISQPPQKYKYQGVARQANGTVVANQNISLRIGIRQTTATGTLRFLETHNTTTNQFGVFNINVGGGSVVGGDFSSIEWSRKNHFQEVEMDITGGTNYVSMGTSQLLSVPYTLSALSALLADSAKYAKFADLAYGVVTPFTLDYNGSQTTLQVNNYGTGLAARFLGGVVINGLATFTGSASLGGTLTVPIINATQGGFSNGLNVGGTLTLAGPINAPTVSTSGSLAVAGTLTAPIFNGVQGGFSNGLNVGGTLTLAGPINAPTVSTSSNLTVGGTLTAPIINGTQGHFTGNLQVDGSISKGSGSFKIDHPLDPENKFLYHSFVESPDMKNIYDGNITTDANGEAVVTMPSYFEKLNRDFRYQITVIGQFAQAIVAGEISNNSFKVKTDKPYVKISWQVTGIRKDAYAEKNRIVPEVEKNSDERGSYLYPAAFGLGQERRIRNK